MSWYFIFYIFLIELSIAQNTSSDTKPFQNTISPGICGEIISKDQPTLPNYFETTETQCASKKFVWTTSHGFVMIRNAERTQIQNLNLTLKSNPTELSPIQNSLNTQFDKTIISNDSKNCQAFKPNTKSYIALTHLEASRPPDTLLSFCGSYMGTDVNLQIKFTVGSTYNGKIILSVHAQKNGKLLLLLGDKTKLSQTPITEQQIIESIISQEEILISDLGKETFKRIDSGIDPDFSFTLQTSDCLSSMSYPSNFNFFKDESCQERKPELPILKPPTSPLGTSKGSN